ncbi:MAG: hypothetical protein HYR98_00815, partial [Nitrospirae bacterium]|nr:hypothetical protein [Nitrospirota bacterium]
EEDGKLEVEGKITVAGASGGLILQMEAFNQKGTYSDCHEKSGEKKSDSETAKKDDDHDKHDDDDHKKS